MNVILTSTGLALLAVGGVVATAAPGDAEPPPQTTLAPLVGDLNLIHTGYVGESLPLDFSANFSGAITGISPSLPHTIDGKTITITPTTTRSATTYTVSAGAQSVQVEIKVVAAPPPLAAGASVPNWSVEVDRPMPRQEWYRHHTGGIPPYQYEQIAGPSWVLTRAGGSRGRAPASPASAQTLTVRVTDQRGDAVDLSCSITVIAARSRTPTYILKSGDASIAAAIAAQRLGSGDVLYIPAALGAVQPGDLSNVDVAQGSAPLIVLGQTGAVVAGPMAAQNSSGIIFENLIFRHLTLPPHNSWAARGGERVWFYNCGFEGFTATINPNDGQSWQSSDTFAYEGSGLWMGEPYSIADRCYADKVEEAYNGRGVMMDCETRRYRDDATIIQRSLGLAIIGHRTVTYPTGNWLSGNHRDLIQGFSDNPPTIRHLEISGCITSCEGHAMQGWWFTHIGWSSRARDLSEMWQHVYIAHNVILTGSWNSFSFQRWYDAIVENNVVLMHPAANWGAADARIRHWHTSKIKLRNNIFARLDGGQGDANGGAYMHLIEQTKNVLLPQSNRAAYSTVFPAFENTRLATLDRMQISSSWAAANPGVGPAMLLRGA